MPVRKKTKSKKATRKKVGRRKNPCAPCMLMMNPISAEDITPNMPVTYRGRILTVKKLLPNRWSVILLDKGGREHTVSIDDIDHPKLRSPTSTELIIEKALEVRKPKYVKFTDYLIDNPKYRLEIMIFQKLNDNMQPVTKWHYAVDVTDKNLQKTLSVISEKKIEGFDSFEDAKRAALAITRTRLGIDVPRSISPVNDKKIVKL